MRIMSWREKRRVSIVNLEVTKEYTAHQTTAEPRISLACFPHRGIVQLAYEKIRAYARPRTDSDEALSPGMVGSECEVARVRAVYPPYSLLTRPMTSILRNCHLR
jgi:hypothetical protein